MKNSKKLRCEAIQQSSDKKQSPSILNLNNEETRVTPYLRVSS